MNQLPSTSTEDENTLNNWSPSISSIACFSESNQADGSFPLIGRYTLVCGATGTGKTNTCFQLLEQIQLLDIPFLIVESRKTEYSDFLSSAIKHRIRRFAPGGEFNSLLSLNPFFVPNGISINSHIEAVVSIFVASFHLDASLSQGLTMILRDLYTAYGWDLALNRNFRLADGCDDLELLNFAFPNLRELSEHITSSACSWFRVAPEFHSFELILFNLINSPAASVFAGQPTVRFDVLFNESAIVELEHLQDAAHKSFFMNLLLLSLLEYRRSSNNLDLRHILLVDDAHKMFCGDQEKTHAAALCNRMISELATTKQRVVISAQTPSLLREDIPRDATTKIIHRLMTQQDVDSLNLAHVNKQQLRRICTLKAGQAMFIDESIVPCDFSVATSALTSRFPPDDLKLTSFVQPTIMDVRLHCSSNRFDEEHNDSAHVVNPEDNSFGCSAAEKHADEESVVVRDPTEIGRLANIRNCSTEVVNSSNFRTLYNRYILSTLLDLKQIVKFRAQLIHEIQRVNGRKVGSSPVPIALSSLRDTTERYFHRKARFHPWTYEQLREQKTRWEKLLKPAFDPTVAVRRLDISELREWRDDVHQVSKLEEGPYPACASCTSKCVYRSEVDETIQTFQELLYDSSYAAKMDVQGEAHGIAHFFWLFAQTFADNTEDLDLPYCLAVHIQRERGLAEEEQTSLLLNVRAALVEIQTECMQDENGAEGELPQKSVSAQTRTQASSTKPASFTLPSRYLGNRNTTSINFIALKYSRTRDT